jgi:hypothetical protein
MKNNNLVTLPYIYTDCNIKDNGYIGFDFDAEEAEDLRIEEERRLRDEEEERLRCELEDAEYSDN